MGLSTAKPWAAEGMSRATWYRRRETSPNAAIPPLKSGETNETSPNAAILSYAEDGPVSPERKQGASEEELEQRTRDKPLPTSLVLEGGVLLTRRWIAAREKACGC